MEKIRNSAPGDYELVLMDIQMPVMNGYEVLQVMKERLWLDRIPVISISADSSDDNIGRAYKLGVSDYFSRPFDAAVVLRRVQNTIALHDKSMGNIQDTFGNAVSFLLCNIESQPDNRQLSDIEKMDLTIRKKYFRQFYILFQGDYAAFADVDCIYEDDKKKNILSFVI